MKKVSVIGLGYIGLPTAVLAAESGYDVLGYDIDEHKVEKINQGDPVIEEIDLKDRLEKVIKQKKLRASTALLPANYYIIAVPTPFKRGKKADLRFVHAAGMAVAEVIKKGQTVILESTVPVGATAALAAAIENKSSLRAGKDIFIAHCPERVLPGNIFYELIHNERLIGGINPASARRARDFYAAFVKNELVLCDDKTAEMVKLVENSSRDVAIAFANQVAAMARAVSINPFEVIELANKHPRVNILQPGCGVGGHCIAVDPWFLVEQFPQQSTLLKRARLVNDRRPGEVAQEVTHAALLLRKTLARKPRILLLGLTFKPNIDDIRQSPALEIAHELYKEKKSMQLAVCEPHLSNTAIKEMGFTSTELQAGILWADIVVVLVKHKAFMRITLSSCKEKHIIDTCGLFYEIDKTYQPLTFHAARADQEEEQQASLAGIQKYSSLKSNE